MLVGPGYIVASPTKTGARSLARLARTQPELGLRYIPSGHSMTVPAEFAGYERHLIVRDPYARLASMYVYLRRRVGDWGHDAAKSLCFESWVEWFLNTRQYRRCWGEYDGNAPSIWLATQAECWRLLGGNVFWKLEAIGDFLAAMNIRAELPVVNAATEPKPAMPAECRERVRQEWAREDCELFGYAT